MSLIAEARSSRSKPTAGHPSQRSAILSLHAQGVDPHDIAERLGTTVNTVRARISSTRAAPPAPKPPAAAEVRSGGRPASSVELNHDVVRLLRSYAVRRDTTVNQIAREIVEAALEQGLVDRLLEGRF